MRKLGFLMLLALGGCGSVVTAIATASPDPTVVAKINYVCAYSGLFKFADTAAASVVPVPGAAMAASLINARVDETCLHPENAARDIAVVENLIGTFKAAGKM